MGEFILSNVPQISLSTQIFKIYQTIPNLFFSLLVRVSVVLMSLLAPAAAAISYMVILESSPVLSAWRFARFHALSSWDLSDRSKDSTSLHFSIHYYQIFGVFFQLRPITCGNLRWYRMVNQNRSASRSSFLIIPYFFLSRQQVSPPIFAQPGWQWAQWDCFRHEYWR